MMAGSGSGRGRSAQIAVEVSEEYPAWVRECDQDFKDKKCTLTHEGRTKDKWRAFVGRLESSNANPFRKAARYRCSACEAAARKRGRSKKLNHNYGALPLTALVETEGCTCHTEIRSMLPNLDTQYVPDELLAPSQPAGPAGKRRKVAPSSRTPSRSTRVKLEPGLDESEAVANIFGGADDEGLASQGGEAEEGEGGGEKEGKEEGEARKTGEEGDEDEEVEVEEDLEIDDYEAGAHCDDDDDLVDEGGGGSDDEETRYGTY